MQMVNRIELYLTGYATLRCAEPKNKLFFPVFFSFYWNLEIAVVKPVQECMCVCVCV